MLSNLSRIPPDFLTMEKSPLSLKIFLYKKKISPQKIDIDRTIDKKILKFIRIKSKVLNKNDTEVPDQVLFGLILGKILGPPTNLPEM